MFLMFNLGRPDVFSGGDLGLRRGIQIPLGLDEPPTPEEAVAIAERWRPHRTLASIYLWEAARLSLGLCRWGARANAACEMEPDRRRRPPGPGRGDPAHRDQRQSPGHDHLPDRAARRRRATAGRRCSSTCGSSIAVAVFLLPRGHRSPLRRARGRGPGMSVRWRAAINPARWWEYSISASLMVVLIAMLSGVREADGPARPVRRQRIDDPLRPRYGARQRGPRDIDWRPFVYGCLAGAVPWLAIGLQLAVSQTRGPAASPASSSRSSSRSSSSSTASPSTCGCSTAGVGRWADPVFCEKAYLVLSLLAKSALAWQVYAGALAGS